MSQRNLIIVAVLLGLLIIIGVVYHIYQSPKLVAVSFGQAVSDEAVLSLVKQYYAEPTLFYGVAGDLSGSYPANAKNTADDLAAYRQTTIEMQLGSKASSISRAKDILATVSINDPRFQQEGNYIVHRFRTSIGIEQNLLAGGPLVCALELKVPADEVGLLQKDPRLKRVELAEFLPLTRKGPAFIAPQPQCVGSGGSILPGLSDPGFLRQALQEIADASATAKESLSPDAKAQADEESVIKALAENWKSIAPKIIPNYPSPSQAFYGYPNAIQFIGNNKMLISYDTDFNEYLALLSYDSNENFAYIDQEMINSSRPSNWQKWVTNYGSPSATLNFYKFSSTREGDTVYLSDWIKTDSGKNDFE